MQVDLNKEYFEGIKKGDSLILKKLFLDVGRSITNYVMQNSGTKDDGADFYRMAVVKTRMKIEKGEITTNDKIAGFIYGVARNDWLDHLRKKKSRRNKEIIQRDASIDDYNNFTDASANPEEMVVRNETVQQLHRCIKKLSELCEEVLSLHYFEGKKLIEISEMLDVKEGTIRKRKFTCERTLKKCMEDSMLK